MASIVVIAEETIKKAQQGEKVTTEERRHAIEYIMGVYPDWSNVKLSQIFDVDVKTIRNDKKIIKTANAERVREDTDVKLIIADLLAARERALQEIEEGKKDIVVSKKTGTPNHLAWIKAGLEIHIRVTEALQNMGWLPKNIGAISITKNVFKAVVQTNTGIVETRPVDLLDDIRPGESLEELMRRKGLLGAGDQVIDAEILPAPENETDNATQTTGRNESERDSEGVST